MKYLTILTAAVLSAAAPTVKKEPVVDTPPVTVRTTTLARVVQYGPRDTVRLTTRPMYVTAIVLPESEKIAHFLCGDKDFWYLSGMANMAWIKPSQNKRETNVQLITLSGNVYSLQAISDESLEADFKIFIEPKDEKMLAALHGPARFIDAAEVSGLKTEVEQWRLEAYRLRKETEGKVLEAKAQAAAQAPAQAKHEYKFTAHQAPFNLAAMWHDGRFTYIQATPEELPALYEIRDDKPNLIKFQFADGMYTVDKVLQSGYFVIGKKKMGFERSK